MIDDIDESQYGEDAFTNKRYGHMTEKQQAVCDEIVERRGEHWTYEMIAEEVGCSPATVGNTLKRYPHVIEQRRSTMRVATDGGGGVYDVRLTSDDLFKMIKSLPPELSQKLWNQVRQDPARSDGGTNSIDADVFDDDGNLK